VKTDPYISTSAPQASLLILVSEKSAQDLLMSFVKSLGV
jgi:hypothetical protein